MNLATIWWMNRERRKHEARAEEALRRAERETDPRRKQQLLWDAQTEAQRAKRLETGVRL